MYLDQPSLTASLEQAIKTTGPGEPQSDDVVDLDASEFLPDAEDHRSLLGIVRPIVATLLYICSAEPDIVDPDRPGARPRRAARAAATPQVWEVGYRIGTALRKAKIEARRPRWAPQLAGGPRPSRALAQLLVGAEVRA